jgi:hypothetical protein
MDLENVLLGNSMVPPDTGDHDNRVYHTGNQRKPRTQLDGVEISPSACQIPLICTDIN